MGLLLDSSVLIGYESQRFDASALVSGREDEPFFVSVVTASELLHGVHRAADERTRAVRSAWVEALLCDAAVLAIDLETARTHARIWADLAAEGQLIGAHDLWLAAQAIAHGLTLATLNVREFERVSGLRFEDWSTPAV